MQTTIDYEKQAIDFLKVTDTKFKAVFIENGIHWEGDKDYRDIFKVTFKRDNRSFSLRFGQSIAQSTGTGDNLPHAYDVLTCLTKYEVEDFDYFCGEFGYDDLKLSEYPKIKKTWKACKKEYSNVCKIWTKEEIELLQEIN